MTKIIYDWKKSFAHSFTSYFFPDYILGFGFLLTAIGGVFQLKYLEGKPEFYILSFVIFMCLKQFWRMPFKYYRIGR